MIAETEIMIGHPIEGSSAVAPASKEGIVPAYNAAKRALFWDTKGTEVLSEYYLYWVTVIDDCLPHSYETVNDYRRRLDERTFVLQHDANRLRMAAGLIR